MWQFLFYGGRVQTMSVCEGRVKTEGFYGSHVQSRLLWGLISDPLLAELISLLYNWYVPADFVRGGEQWWLNSV
jgi:hypothetical protein